MFFFKKIFFIVLNLTSISLSIAKYTGIKNSSFGLIGLKNKKSNRKMAEDYKNLIRSFHGGNNIHYFNQFYNVNYVTNLQNLEKENNKIIVLDIETTGLHLIKGDKIVEISCLKIENNKIIDQFHSFINPEKKVSKEAFNIHKLSNQFLKDKPKFDEKIALKFIKFIDDSTLMVHKANFDLPFINVQISQIKRDLKEENDKIEKLLQNIENQDYKDKKKIIIEYCKNNGLIYKILKKEKKENLIQEKKLDAKVCGQILDLHKKINEKTILQLKEIKNNVIDLIPITRCIDSEFYGGIMKYDDKLKGFVPIYDTEELGFVLDTDQKQNDKEIIELCSKARQIPKELEKNSSKPEFTKLSSQNDNQTLIMKKVNCNSKLKKCFIQGTHLYNLDSMLHRFGIHDSERKKQHGALIDCNLLWKLFSKMRKLGMFRMNIDEKTMSNYIQNHYLCQYRYYNE